MLLCRSVLSRLDSLCVIERTKPISAIAARACAPGMSPRRASFEEQAISAEG
jgi:hypothetical protein